jgi:hypothetical protein
MLASNSAATIPKHHLAPQNWASFLTGSDRPVAVIDLTSRKQHSSQQHRQIWEIFGCPSDRLFAIEPLQGKLSDKDLSVLESVVLLEGLGQLVILLDAPSSIVPPPGYERLIWHIDPEYCGQQRQQELLKATIQTLGHSRYLKKMWTEQRLEVLTANYDRHLGIIERSHRTGTPVSTNL